MKTFKEWLVESVDPSYFDIGHDGPAILWVIDKKGNFDSSDDAVDHSWVWDAEWEYWRGRYDLESKQVSLIPPDNIHVTRVPINIKNILKKQFPDNRGFNAYNIRW